MPKTIQFLIHQIIKVHDGDTLTVILDRGFSDYSTREVRLYGIDTPELVGPTRPQGKLVRDAVVAWLARAISPPAPAYPGAGLTLNSYQLDEKYGRVLGDIFDASKERNSLTQYLLENHLAIAYGGGKKAVWTPELLKSIDTYLGVPAWPKNPNL